VVDSDDSAVVRLAGSSGYRRLPFITEPNLVMQEIHERRRPPQRY
jgi:hypothetical protein